MQTLDLSCSGLGTSIGIMQLALGHLPLLSRLNLSQSDPNSHLGPFEHANHAKGRWPPLTCLGLACNGIYDDCAAQLASAD